MIYISAKRVYIYTLLSAKSAIQELMLLILSSTEGSHCNPRKFIQTEMHRVKMYQFNNKNIFFLRQKFLHTVKEKNVEIFSIHFISYSFFISLKTTRKNAKTTRHIKIHKTHKNTHNAQKYTRINITTDRYRGMLHTEISLKKTFVCKRTFL